MYAVSQAPTTTALIIEFVPANNTPGPGLSIANRRFLKVKTHLKGLPPGLRRVCRPSAGTLNKEVVSHHSSHALNE